MLKKILLILLFVFWALPALAETIWDTAWVRRYSGSADREDVPSAIAVDSLGNIYVTGYSRHHNCTPYDADWVTMKYDPNGTELWVSTYNGPADDDDHAWDLALDDLGNVYVTGSSFGLGTSYDYATIKYDSSGTKIWESRYNGPDDHWDMPCAVAVDDSGNVYVTGSSVGSGGYITGYDYATVKYDGNGNELWVQRYNGPKDLLDAPYGLALDATGGVCVTGISFDSAAAGLLYKSAYATLKYDTSGNRIWIRRYNGPTNTLDGASGIATDGLGNVYVTGFSDGTGTWLDYAPLKYDSSGNEVWVRRYAGLGEDALDEASAITVDASNNVYVTGYSRHSHNLPDDNSDWATVKYTASGDEVWVKRYSGPDALDDEANAIAVSGSGNIYVTGFTCRRTTSRDYTTIAYGQDGTELWLLEYDGPANGVDEALAIAVDGLGNVYVTGSSFDEGTHRDFATIKYLQALRGDMDGDQLIDIQDIAHLITYLYQNGSAPQPLEAGNANCDELVDLTDVLHLINYVLKEGPPPDC